MKQKKLKKYIITAMAVMLTACTWFGLKQASAAAQALQKIDAEYYGESLHVGQRIRMSDIYVMGTYLVYESNYSYTDMATIRSGFTIRPATVQKEGENIVTVTYQGKTDVITVEGKKLEFITAQYTGEEVTIGSPIPKAKVEVTGYYNDGSQKRLTDFTLSQDKVTKVGSNIITVVSGKFSTEIFVMGKEPLAVVNIWADTGYQELYVGDAVIKSEIKVTAMYNDGTIKDVGDTFTIFPETVDYIGLNEIEVSYQGFTDIIQVYAVEKQVERLEIIYIGPGVMIGDTVKKEDFKVTVFYEDGSSRETSDFEIYDTEMLWEDNVVFIYCEDVTDSINVPAMRGFDGNFDNPVSTYVAGAMSLTNVTLGLNPGVERTAFEIKRVSQAQAERIVRRVVMTEDFVAFDLKYQEDEMVVEFPMSMKVSIPAHYDREKFGVYYTPNKSTIMAKINGKFTDETKTEYQFPVYDAGTYILVNEDVVAYVKEIVVEEELQLKAKRNFTLKPKVYPASADNKGLKFFSTDESIATVSENGNIKTLKAGTCQIIISTKDQGGASAVVTLTVE